MRIDETGADMRWKRGRRGQATTEWMVLVSVGVVGVVAVGWLLAGSFGSDMSSFGHRAETVYTSGDLGR